MSFKKLLPIFFVVLSFGAMANNMLVQNVTTTGNDPVNKTIQVQFDMSWDNSWRDAINWDAAWVFIKFKDVNGLWQHAQLNLAGFANGTGIANTVKVTSDKVGAWVYRSALGSGTFNCTSMQLQWNYGLNGLDDASGLEVRVFATEMVYVPQGEFNCAKLFYDFSSNTQGCRGEFLAPGSNFIVINNKLSPQLKYNDILCQGGSLPINVRIKGDAGLDTNLDGIIETQSYPTGYFSFYCNKYEQSEQQYADFLNTLTTDQISNLGIAGSGISNLNGQYFSSTPNRACGFATNQRVLALADWSGVRPMTFLEINKVCYGQQLPKPFPGNPPILIVQGVGYYFGYPAWGPGMMDSLLFINLYDVGRSASANSTRVGSGSSIYGIMDLTDNAHEPFVKLSFFDFSGNNGNGNLNNQGNANVSSWNENMIMHFDQFGSTRFQNSGFRYVRFAE